MADNDFMATGYLTKIKAEMEERLGCKIVFVEDRDSSYPCKIEYARNYARQHHVLRVNPARCINAYPIFFLLLNTKLQIQKTDAGGLGLLQPVSNADEHARFNADFKADPVGRKLIATLGSGADAIVMKLCASLITQACNQVLEMLAADVVLRDYPDAVEDMKRYLASSAVEGAAVPYQELRQTYPAFIVKANRILNLMFAMRCGEICGKKLIDAYKPTSDDVDKALDLYNFYLAERDLLKTEGRIVGDVLENILYKLKVARYVHLEVREIAPEPESAQDVADDGLTDEQRESLKKFRENFGDGKSDYELMVLGMFKVLREVSKMPLEAVRAIAIEIAMLGTNGISPNKTYNLKTMPNRKDIMGLEVLAYYYVTWAKVFPDKLDMIGLPYKKAYDSAVAMMESFSGDNSSKSTMGGGVIHRITCLKAA